MNNKSVLNYLYVIKDWLIHLKNSEVEIASALEYLIQKEQKSAYIDSDPLISNLYLNIDDERTQMLSIKDESEVDAQFMRMIEKIDQKIAELKKL